MKQTASKQGKEYIKAVYCYPACWSFNGLEPGGLESTMRK